MGKIKRYKNSIERFLSGENGQRFFNFAYSIGAAIVIWGALFKLLHLPGGNLLLTIGMGTEVLMFVLSAFDRPPKSYNWEEVFPVLDTKDPEDRPDFTGGTGVIVGGIAGNETSAETSTSVTLNPEQAGIAGTPYAAEITSATQSYLDKMAAITEEMQHLCETTQALNKVSDILLDSYRAITENSENITRSSTGYVEQMQDLSRNIGGLNTIYEIQLKSVSSQLDSIDRVNRGIKDIRDMYEKSSAQSARYCEETEKMARYMQQLNSVYEKMITAMTINMYRPMMGGTPDVPPMPEKPATSSENV